MITASAPGSVMVTGEHAVVYGHPALVAAIDQRITVKATPLDQPILTIESEIADPLSVPLEAVQPEGPYRFIQAAAALYRDRLDHGLGLRIRSAIDPTLGLGSSAAVTVAALGVFAHMAGDAPSSVKQRLHGEALGIVRAIQGRGSGADLAASLYGGMVAYQLPPTMLTGVPARSDAAMITPVPPPPPLSLGYAGYKTPTGEVLAQIAQRMEGHEAAFDALYARMGTMAATAIEAAQIGDQGKLMAALNGYQRLMVELGVSDDVLDGLVHTALATDGVEAAKISGSGLGDCVLAVGAAGPEVPTGFNPAPLATEGLQLHG